MALNVYQLYEEAGEQCPFMVKQVKWGKTAFVVNSIGGHEHGSLVGQAPYYGNPDVHGCYVETDTFMVIPDKINGDNILTCAGNGKWELMYKSHELTRVDNPK